MSALNISRISHSNAGRKQNELACYEGFQLIKFLNISRYVISLESNQTVQSLFSVTCSPREYTNLEVYIPHYHLIPMVQHEKSEVFLFCFVLFWGGGGGGFFSLASINATHVNFYI